MKIEELVGKKIRGFKFESKEGGFQFNSYHAEVVGEIGQIFGFLPGDGKKLCSRIGVFFENETPWYPYPECLEHILTEEEFAAFEELKIKEQRLETIKKLRNLSKKCSNLTINIQTETCIAKGTHNVSNILQTIADLLED